jgi:hypothetical protein
MQRTAKSAISLSVASIFLGGCWGPSSFTAPDRLYTLTEEMAAVRAYYEDPADLWKDYRRATDQKTFRNNVITARMYAIDMAYTKYEAGLTIESQAVDFGATAVSLTLNTVGGLIPVIQTSHALSEAAGAVTGLNGAYNDKVLRSKIIGNVQAAMRIGRHDQAAIIFANMKCSVAKYPLAMALSDVETYYRAGTFSSGLIKLTQTVWKAEADAKAHQESQTPAQPPAATAHLEGAGDTTQAKSEAANCADVSGSGPIASRSSNGPRFARR